MDPFNTRQRGKQAELAACRFLEAKGFKLLVENYHCYNGEIDLIMQDGNDIVFVEVRSRNRTDYGQAAETINKSKRNKLIRAATHFLQMKKWLYKVNSRFDIIAIHYLVNGTQVEWIKNAFLAE